MLVQHVFCNLDNWTLHACALNLTDVFCLWCSGMFGAGIYFADKSSKSNQYTGRSSSSVRYMFLSKVVMGNACKAKKSMRQARSAPICHRLNQPYDSVKAEAGCPNDRGSALKYAEYIVYEKFQVCTIMHISTPPVASLLHGSTFFAQKQNKVCTKFDAYIACAHCCGH